MLCLCHCDCLQYRSSGSITYPDGKLGRAPGFVSTRARIVSLELVSMCFGPGVGMRTTRTEHYQSRKLFISPMVKDYCTASFYVPYFLNILSHVILGPSTSSVYNKRLQVQKCFRLQYAAIVSTNLVLLGRSS